MLLWTGEDLHLIDVPGGAVKWSVPGLWFVISDDARGSHLLAQRGPRIVLIETETGKESPTDLPDLDNSDFGHRTADGRLWFQTVLKERPSLTWYGWLLSFLGRDPDPHQRLYAIDPATGRPTFQLAGSDLCKYHPLPDGTAVVTCHQNKSVQRMTLHDARPVQSWPKFVGVACLLCGLAVLVACFGKRAGTVG